MDIAQIKQLTNQLTLEEKIGMIHGVGLFTTKGVERLGIPPLKMADGPMGVRQEFENSTWIPKGTDDDYVSYLPSNSALACTWNRSLLYKVGKVLGEEARGRGKDVILAPGINIMRTPLFGRNFEYMSEDPFLISELTVPIITGIQKYEVAACVKHFIANNQETNRLKVNVKMSERALREIYLPGFKAAIEQGKSRSIMGAYNQFRGEHCCHNQYILQKVLRDEWGFDGPVISDWGGVHDTLEAAYNGLDIEMSVTDCFDEYYMANPLLEKINAGEIPIGIIDEKIKHILVMMEQNCMFSKTRQSGTYNAHNNQEIILTSARESIVLLKNQENRLPLNMKKSKTLAVIGENAIKRHSNGGGSAAIKALYECSPLMGLKMELGGDIDVRFARGYMSDPQKTDENYDWQSSSLEDRIEKAQYQEKLDTQTLLERDVLIHEAVELARTNNEAILVCGLNHEFDLEGQDKANMKLPYGQDELIKRVLQVNPNTVIVVMTGSPVEMESFTKKAKAIVYMSYSGMEGGRALAEILLGKTNPSGKLAYTIPKKLEDSPAHQLGEFPGSDNVTYHEDIFIGYRYYETFHKDVEFPFGHGLSYTTYSYKNLSIIKQEQEYIATVEVENTGYLTGSEVIQLYVQAKGKKVHRSFKELRGFKKVTIAPKEIVPVTFFLSQKAFSYYNDTIKKWEIPEDQYTICVGSSVKDIRLKQQLNIHSCIIQ